MLSILPRASLRPLSAARLSKKGQVRSVQGFGEYQADQNQELLREHKEGKTSPCHAAEYTRFDYIAAGPF